MKTLHKILILSLILCTGFTAQAQEDDRKKAFLEVGYGATSFEEVGESGYYGIGWTCLNWNINQNLYAGFHFSPFAFNFGLSDLTYDLIQFGPALGGYISPSLAVAMPLDVMCALSFEEDSSTTWALGLAPTFYIGKKSGIYLGPAFTFPFTKGAKTTVGFKAGLFF